MARWTVKLNIVDDWGERYEVSSDIRADAGLDGVDDAMNQALAAAFEEADRPIVGIQIAQLVEIG